MNDRTEFPLFTIGFRPFFLLGACWSAIALAIWTAAFISGRALPTALPAVTWHIHEMLFGFVLATIAGFILTAVANWTGRPPIAGRTLAAFVILWVAGRVLNLFSALASFWIVTVVDVAFPVTLALLVTREITIARSWRNLMMPLPIVLLALGDLLMYLETAGEPVPVDLGWRLGLAAVITLISVVGPGSSLHSPAIGWPRNKERPSRSQTYGSTG